MKDGKASDSRDSAAAHAARKSSLGGRNKDLCSSDGDDDADDDNDDDEDDDEEDDEVKVWLGRQINAVRRA
jgi:hypothetical protein